MNTHLARLTKGCTSPDGVLDAIEMSWLGKDVNVCLCTGGEVYVGVPSMLQAVGLPFDKALEYGLACKDQVSYRGFWSPVAYYGELKTLMETDAKLKELDKVKAFDWEGFERALYVACRKIAKDQVKTIKKQLRKLETLKRKLEEDLEQIPAEGRVEPLSKKPRVIKVESESEHVAESEESFSSEELSESGSDS